MTAAARTATMAACRTMRLAVKSRASSAVQKNMVSNKSKANNNSMYTAPPCAEKKRSARGCEPRSRGARLALFRQSFAARSIVEVAAGPRNDLTGQAEFLIRQADWRCLAAKLNCSKKVPGLAGRFR